MPETLPNLLRGALDDLKAVFERLPETAADGLIEEILAARRIVVYGCGREGLQMRGFAMRLFHMGRNVAVWGAMTTPDVCAGDLLIVSAGPGDLATARTLAGIARGAGARTLLVTVDGFDIMPDGRCVLTARWSVLGADRQGIAASERASVVTMVPIGSDGMKDADIVAAMAAAVGQLADRVAFTLSRAR